jgi:hypothetical protein
LDIKNEINETGKIINQYKIGLEKKDNPEYYDILRKHNEIMSEWNTINKEFQKLKQPKLFLMCYKSKMKSFNIPLENLTCKYIEWNNLATSFLNKPNFSFDANNDRMLSFIHYSRILSDTINRLSNNMDLIMNNYVKIQNQYSNQLNFNIAVFSTIISFCGLCVALWTILK